MNEFSRSTLKVLSRKGIYLVGLQAIPDMSSSMPWANADRGYVVNDNGTCRVLSFTEVMAMTNPQHKGKTNGH